MEQQSFRVEFNWKDSTTTVFDHGSKNVLYVIEHKAFDSLRFSRSDDQYAGKAKFHFIKYRIDLEVRGQALPLKPMKKAFGTCNYAYESPAFHNQTISWVADGLNRKSLEYECLNDSQELIARMVVDPHLVNNIGKFDILGPFVGNDAMKEELLMVGLTLTLNRLKSTVAAWSPEPTTAGLANSYMEAVSTPVGRMF